MNMNVTVRADKKFRIITGSFKLDHLAKILSKTTKEVIKTTIGPKKATTTFQATEGPFKWPNC